MSLEGEALQSSLLHLSRQREHSPSKPPFALPTARLLLGGVFLSASGSRLSAGRAVQQEPSLRLRRSPPPPEEDREWMSRRNARPRSFSDGRFVSCEATHARELSSSTAAASFFCLRCQRSASQREASRGFGHRNGGDAISLSGETPPPRPSVSDVSEPSPLRRTSPFPPSSALGVKRGDGAFSGSSNQVQSKPGAIRCCTFGCPYPAPSTTESESRWQRVGCPDTGGSLLRNGGSLGSGGFCRKTSPTEKRLFSPLDLGARASPAAESVCLCAKAAALSSASFPSCDSRFSAGRSLPGSEGSSLRRERSCGRSSPGCAESASAKGVVRSSCELSSSPSSEKTGFVAKRTAKPVFPAVAEQEGEIAAPLVETEKSGASESGIRSVPVRESGAEEDSASASSEASSERAGVSSTLVPPRSAEECLDTRCEDEGGCSGLPSNENALLSSKKTPEREAAFPAPPPSPSSNCCLPLAASPVVSRPSGEEGLVSAASEVSATATLSPTVFAADSRCSCTEGTSPRDSRSCASSRDTEIEARSQTSSHWCCRGLGGVSRQPNAGQEGAAPVFQEVPVLGAPRVSSAEELSLASSFEKEAEAVSARGRLGDACSEVECNKKRLSKETQTNSSSQTPPPRPLLSGASLLSREFLSSPTRATAHSPIKRARLAAATPRPPTESLSLPADTGSETSSDLHESRRGPCSPMTTPASNSASQEAAATQQPLSQDNGDRVFAALNCLLLKRECSSKKQQRHARTAAAQQVAQRPCGVCADSRGSALSQLLTSLRSSAWGPLRRFVIGFTSEARSEACADGWSSAGEEDSAVAVNACAFRALYAFQDGQWFLVRIFGSGRWRAQTGTCVFYFSFKRLCKDSL